MTHYKLTYFDIDGGRAEAIRIAFFMQQDATSRASRCASRRRAVPRVIPITAIEPLAY